MQKVDNHYTQYSQMLQNTHIGHFCELEVKSVILVDWISTIDIYR